MRLYSTLPYLFKEYTAIVAVFTLHTLRRWPNGAVAVQITLARNPEGSGIETMALLTKPF